MNPRQHRGVVGGDVAIERATAMTTTMMSMLPLFDKTLLFPLMGDATQQSTQEVGGCGCREVGEVWMGWEALVGSWEGGRG
jgi:hypothetical protein